MSQYTHQFSRVPQADIPRSSFDRSHGHTTSFEAGLLVPMYVDEVVPGDTFNLRATAFIRLTSPLKFPIMDNLRLSTFFFFVPTRLVWSNFRKFMGEQDNPGDSTDYTVPTTNGPSGSGYDHQSLQDYMGIPPGVPDLDHNCLPMRCYNKIVNDWFRDQNLSPSLTVDMDDGPDDETNYTLQRRNKRHDYFTAALPWPQKGDSVSLPLGDDANVTSKSPFIPQFNSSNIKVDSSTGATTGVPGALYHPSPIPSVQDLTWSATRLEADLAGATAATINQLRQAFQIQKLLERDARGGTRYTEIVRSHFGIRDAGGDARLQRPEYLGGGTAPINITTVPNTSATATEDQASLAAYGVGTAQGHGFTKSFTEHGYVIGLVCVDADLRYQQGLNRLWNRRTRYDFFFPVLANIGEQSILNKELYAQGQAGGTADDETFGYSPRYDEYRYHPARISGKMRSSDPQSLDYMHLSEDFASLPALNATFMSSQPPMARIQAVTTEPDFICDWDFRLRCARPMPLYGVPGMIDHF